MENIDNIMQLCRLCLVKEQVNIPIFGQNNDLEEISAKIRSCLPVKVSPDDSLPKKICDGCSYKLDLLYVFRNTSINSEKQLYQWLEQAGISKTTAATATTMSTPSVTATTIPTTPAVPSTDPIIPTIPATNTTALDNIVNDAITKSEISVKQEKSDSTAGSELSAETQEYLLQQQKLPYQESFGDFNTETNSAEPEEPARKKLRRAAASKPPIKDNESDPDMPPTKAEDDSDEDMDDMGDGGMDDDDDEDEEEEEDGLDHPEFVDVPSTSAEEQPGPSGVNKDPIAAPLKNRKQKATCRDKKYVQCPYCDRLYPSRGRLNHHIAVHRQDRPYPCEICNKSFKYERTRNFHKHRYHFDEIKLFKCNICNKELKFEEGLKRHLRRHTENFSIICELCGRGFLTNGEYKQHKNDIHDRANLCNVCGRSFCNKESLKSHMKRHDDNYMKIHNFQCDLCKKRFRQDMHLKKHIRRMHNENRRKYICDLCNKELASQYGLTVHRKIHQGLKLNECTVCGKKFVRLSTLKEHIRIHSGEKPYICDVCGRSFSQRTPLRIHLRLHTGEKPYFCNSCDGKFITKAALCIHMRNKH